MLAMIDDYSYPSFSTPLTFELLNFTLMDTGSKVLFFVSALGAFNGLILSIYFFFFSAKRRLSNYMFAALLLVLSIRIAKSVALLFVYGLPKI
jgi:hypothetical protein